MKKSPKELQVDKQELARLGESEFEQKYVHDVYDKIASHFSHTRYRGWPRVCQWLRTHSSPGDLVIDIGCGNGKYCTSVHPDALWLGVDFSNNLLQQAVNISVEGSRLFAKEGFPLKIKPVEVFRGDALSLPFKPNTADLTICIAMLHHLTSDDRRVQALVQILKVTKRRCLIYVWAEEQTQGSIGAREFSDPEMLVAWHLPTEVCYRYYKTFGEQEIRTMVEHAISLVGRGRVCSVEYDSNNWAVDITM